MSDNLSHAERIQDLTTDLMECRKYGGFMEGYIGVDDVTYLLRRVAELEREIWEKDEYIIDLERKLDAERDR